MAFRALSLSDVPRELLYFLVVSLFCAVRSSGGVLEGRNTVLDAFVSLVAIAGTFSAVFKDNNGDENMPPPALRCSDNSCGALIVCTGYILYLVLYFYGPSVAGAVVVRPGGLLPSILCRGGTCWDHRLVAKECLCNSFSPVLSLANPCVVFAKPKHPPDSRRFAGSKLQGAN